MKQHNKDAVNARLRQLEVIQDRSRQSVWLTKFTLGALLTIALAGGAGIAQLNREVVGIKTDVKWIVSLLNKETPNVEDRAETSTRSVRPAPAYPGGPEVFRGGTQTSQSIVDLSAGRRCAFTGRFAEGR